MELFYTVLFDPLFNALIGIYHVLPWQDLGLAIIILTILIKLLLAYPNFKALKSQKALSDMQPRMNALKEKYKDDKEELGRKLMEFYKENKVNPFSSCLPLLIQLPIIWALYRVFFGGLTVDESGILVTEELAHLYPQLAEIYSSTALNLTSFGFIPLADNGAWYLALAAAAAQFFSSKLLSKKKPAINTPGAQDEGMAASINKQMMYFMPILTLVFGYQFPAGVTLYWLVSTLFTLGQQWLILGRVNKKEKTPAIVKA